MVSSIKVRGARTHNLKNINLDIPRDQLVVITGLSGSGKSSLAFDTLYAEGQRRYVESLSAYARQFLSMMEKPDVDLIEGLSPAISIEQKTTSNNPRSTVGTITEIYDYLRVLFARVGEPRCPTHQTPLRAQTISQIVDAVLALPEGTKLMVLAPVVDARKGEYQQLFKRLIAQGYVRARLNGELIELADAPQLHAKKKHTIEVVIDRLKVASGQAQRLADSCETALKLGEGKLIIAFLDEDTSTDRLYSTRHACVHCGFSLPELEPRLFSFNSPQGACSGCDGLGMKEFVDVRAVLVEPGLSVAAGAIQGWDRSKPHYFQVLEAVAKHYDVSVEQPFNEWPKAVQEKVLYGTKNEKIRMTVLDSSGKKKQHESAFEGVIAYIERRYASTQSWAVREELSRYFALQPCPECEGTRLKTVARSVYLNEKNLPELTSYSTAQLLSFFEGLALTGQGAHIAQKLLKEIKDRLGFLVNVGLDYLSLNRSAQTLSGGEAQRIRLASQIGSGLVGVMYILDEPSIGLHQRDNQRLLKTLFHLRDLGNSVLVVEHDEEAIRVADHVIDMGPGAGIHGGTVVAEGTADHIQRCAESLTGQYLSGLKTIPVPQRKAIDPERVLSILGASGNNLKHVDVQIPLGLMVSVTGVSGSGKSTLINDTLYPIAATALNGATTLSPAEHLDVEGLEHLDKVISIDQSPIGRTPRSNPATYTGMFTLIRDLFSALPESKLRAYGPGRFSFNVPGGRCEACEGDGVIKVEMHFIADVYVTCEHCQGKRYNRETLEIYYKGKNIHEILEMTVEEGVQFFHAVPPLLKKLQTLMDVGLPYIKLGQSATTMSGGEAQRIKLAKELARRDTGKTLYLLDEPTTGLHFHDVAQLLKVLHRLRDQGNTLVIIEHHLDVIKTSDWIIDMGPEGGSGGGQVVVCGTPEHVAQHPTSHTGRFLAPLLQSRPVRETIV